MAALVRDVPLDWHETAIVLSMCYWHTTAADAQVWPEWWTFVQALRAHARWVVLVTCPVPPALRNGHMLAARNAHLRRLVAWAVAANTTPPATAAAAAAAAAAVAAAKAAAKAAAAAPAMAAAEARRWASCSC